MNAAYAEFAGPRCRTHHHHHHHRGDRGGIEELISFMTGRGGPFGDPRHVQGHVLGPRSRRPGGHGHRGAAARGGRARRGDVRAALLLLIEGGAQNGYQLIQEIERRTDGVWKPSPGSVYPALQQLEDEGLVHAVEFEGKRAYELTDEGRDYVDDNREELGDPFAAATGGVDEGMMDMRGLMFQVGAAAMQVAAAGHTDEAKRILADTRRALYKILAEDDPGETSAAA